MPRKQKFSIGEGIKAHCEQSAKHQADEIEQMMEEIMNQVFSPGYVSPRTGPFYRICRALLESSKPEDRLEFATRLLNLCMYAKDDAIESQ